MPSFVYTDSEPRTYPHVATVLGDDGEPVEFAAHELEEGGVIDAAVNPDPARFVEETAAQRKKREAAALEAAAAAQAELDALGALAALAPEELTALQSLSPADVKALAALTG